MLGEKVPVPPLHMPPPALLTVPAICTVALLEHTVRSTPALTTGEGAMVIVI